MITRIYIDNFRCFTNFEFKPEKINLLLGSNGEGKSSLFDAIRGMVSNLRSGIDLRKIFSPDDITRWDNRREQHFELDVDLHGTSYRYLLRLEQDPEANKTYLREEKVTRGQDTLFSYHDGEVHLHQNDGTQTTHFPFSPARSFLSEMEPQPQNSDLLNLLEYLSGVVALKLVPGAIASLTQEENEILSPDGSNFASWYRNIAQENAGELADMFARIREAIPGFHSLALVGAGKQGRTRDLVVRFSTPDGGRYEVDFEKISDGQRVLIVLHSLLADQCGRSRLLLLDEPENYVAIAEIQPWLVALDEVLGERDQLLMISHHPEVINYLAAEQPYRLYRDHGGPVRVSMVEFDRETGLKASEQLVRGLINVE